LRDNNSSPMQSRSTANANPTRTSETAKLRGCQSTHWSVKAPAERSADHKPDACSAEQINAPQIWAKQQIWM